MVQNHQNFVPNIFPTKICQTFEDLFAKNMKGVLRSCWEKTRIQKISPGICCCLFKTLFNCSPHFFTSFSKPARNQTDSIAPDGVSTRNQISNKSVNISVWNIWIDKKMEAKVFLNFRFPTGLYPLCIASIISNDKGAQFLCKRSETVQNWDRSLHNVEPNLSLIKVRCCTMHTFQSRVSASNVYKHNIFNKYIQLNRSLLLEIKSKSLHCTLSRQ